jgi:hypothetical protein
VLSGREFTEQDDAEHAPVAMISQSFARKYWGTVDPVARRLRLAETRG